MPEDCLMERADAASRLDAANAAYPQIWNDYLRNKGPQANQRAGALLSVLEQVPERFKDADAWATQADFAYIAGAVQDNHEELLEQALFAYDRCLACPVQPGDPPNLNGRRMRAETLLRLHRYELAFDAFAELATLKSASEADAPPFRLRHDADLLDGLARKGRVDAQRASEVSSALRAVASRVATACPAGARPKAKELSSENQETLEAAAFDELWRLAPYPVERMRAWAGADAADESPRASKAAKVSIESSGYACATSVPSACRRVGSVLNESIDWTRAQLEYFDTGVTVVDDLLSPEALAELWSYATEAPSFRTVRYGFLGAFPSDGFTHPLVIQMASALEAQMPKVFGGHPLGLWWLFKYTDEAPRGIGIHADAAAVNVNIWLTPDEARKSGGGLDIFTQVPPEEAAVAEFNQEFSGPEEEAAFRARLEVGGVRRVEYKRNRAAIFVSDLFHVSEPFDFPDHLEAPRVNLTLLFGDRAAARRGHACNSATAKPPPGAAVASMNPEGSSLGGMKTEQDAGWDLFD